MAKKSAKQVAAQAQAVQAEITLTIRTKKRRGG